MNSRNLSLGKIFWTFLKIGSTSFGGLMSLVAAVEDAVVDRRKWLSHQDILDGVLLGTIIPGAISVNVIVYAGYRLRGYGGAIASTIGATLPSFFSIVAMAIVYFDRGHLPAVDRIFAGLIPATAAIISSTAWNMSCREIKRWQEAMLAAIAFFLLILVGGAYLPLIIIFASGAIGWFVGYRGDRREKIGNYRNFWQVWQDNKTKNYPLVLLLFCLSLVYFLPQSLLETHILFNLSITFAKIGTMLFGGAYVGIPFIHELVVNSYHWLNDTEFAYAIAAGQITPGPIVISAAFIGYKVGGILGALAATVGIFTPPTLLVLAGAKVLARLKDSDRVKSALLAMRSSIIGTIFAAAAIVAKTAPVNGLSVSIGAISLFLLVRLRLNFAWIIFGAGLAGFFCAR